MAKATAPVGSKMGTKSMSLHPPYFQMICEAISTLKDRTGSSQQAIAKFLRAKYAKALPPNFKRSLSVQLKNALRAGRLVKVKNSYKLSPSEKTGLETRGGKKRGAEETTTLKRKTKVVVKRSESVKTKRPSQSMKKTAEMLEASKTVAAALAAPAGAKMKRLSQVKTPEALMKTTKRTKKY